MKKIILSLAVLFVMSSFTTRDTTIEKMNENEGPGRDCVNYATNMTLAYAGLNGGTGDPNDYMSYYHNTYLNCYISLTLYTE